MGVLVDGEIVLYGAVGDDYWGEGFTARDVVDALAEIGRSTDVTVRINSGGGLVDDGIAIFNALKAHRGTVRVMIDSIAASAASLIAMAGKTVTMRTGSVMMIHDPSTLTWGNAEDHQQSLKALEMRASQMADIYAERSGQPLDDVRATMAAETWLTPEDAVRQGYADATSAVSAGDPTAFAFSLYAKAPERLRAFASTRGWLPRTARSTASRTKENSMTTPNPAGADKTAPAPDAVAAAATAASQATATAAAEIVTLCVAGGVPAMASGLIARSATVEQAKAAITAAGEIRAAVDQARKVCPQIDAAEADRFIAAGTSIEAVRADLFSRMTAVQSIEIRATHQAAGQTAPRDRQSARALDANAIYATHNKAFGAAR